MRVGNFSVIPRPMLSRLVAMSDLWNHYAATVFKARLPFVTLATPRGYRLAGKSRMNFVALVIHGLSAMSVFSDRIGVRLLIVTTFVLAVAMSGLGAVLAIRLSTDWAIPGWATTATGLLVVVALQGLLMMIVFIMIVLGGRGTAGFLPVPITFSSSRGFVVFCRVNNVSIGFDPIDSQRFGQARADRRAVVGRVAEEVAKMAANQHL